MIISHKYRFIFVKSGKTAGSSLEIFITMPRKAMNFFYSVKPKLMRVIQKLKIGKQPVILSSCRLEALSIESYIHQVHHTHNTKEVIQYIQYIKGDIDIDEKMHRYVFRSCYLDNNFVIDRLGLKEEFLSSDTVFIELCSRKKYLKNSYYIHHLAADKGDAPQNNLIENEKISEEYELIIQRKDEIEADILDIVKLLHDKKIVFVTHIDCGIEVRKALIDEISEICDKHGLLYVNPSDKLDVLKSEMKDSNHYTPRGLKILADYVLIKFWQRSLINKTNPSWNRPQSTIKKTKKPR